MRLLAALLLALTACAPAVPTVDELVGCYEVEVGEWGNKKKGYERPQDYFHTPQLLHLTNRERYEGVYVVEPDWRGRGGNNRWRIKSGKV